MQMGIFPKKSVHDHQFHIGFFQNCLGKFIGVFPFEHNTLDARVHQHFRTDDTGLQGDIDGRTFCADADLCRLNDGILFRMQSTAQFMTLTGRDIQSCPFTAADLCTMFQAGGCTVITCCDDAVVFYDDRPTCLRRQVDRVFTISAISMKYSSQLFL